jgi:hypothetical protein
VPSDALLVIEDLPAMCSCTASAISIITGDRQSARRRRDRRRGALVADIATALSKPFGEDQPAGPRFLDRDLARVLLVDRREVIEA